MHGPSSPRTLRRPSRSVLSGARSKRWLPLLVFFSAITMPLCGATRTWDGSTSTDWFTGSNWSGSSVPTVDDNAVIPTGMPRYPVLNSSLGTCKDLTINSGGSLDLSTYTLTVARDLDVQGTLTSAATGELNFTGTAHTDIVSAFTFPGDIRCSKGGTRSVRFGAGVTFNDLFVDLSKCDLSPTFNVVHSITGDVTIAIGATLDRDMATVTVAGDVTNNGTWNDSDATGGTFLQGDWTDNGSMSIGSQTVTFNGGGTSLVDTPGAGDFYNVTITNNTTVTSVATKDLDINNNLVIDAGSTLNCTDSTDEVNGALTNNGTISIGDALFRVTGLYDNNGITTLSTGTLDANGEFDSTGGSLTFTDSGRARLAGTVTSLGTLTPSTGTVEYDNKSSDSTVLAAAYNDLVIDSGGWVATTAGDITVADDLTIASGELEVDDGDNLQVDDNVVVNGVLDLEPGVVLELDNSTNFQVNAGGTLETIGEPGYAGDYVVITSNNGSDRYTFTVNAGGILKASKTYFRFMDASGIQITDDATVTALTQLDQCVFDNGASGGTLLQINDNDNAVTLNYLQFFDSNSNLSFNVGVSSATATITIDGYDDDTHGTGFGGPGNENDPGDDLVWGVTSPARLRDFSAQQVAGGVLLEWETLAEWQLAGFALERSSGGPFQRIGPGLLPATGTAPAGSRYQWLDDTRTPAHSVSYRLVEVEQNGFRRVLAEQTTSSRAGWVTTAAQVPRLSSAPTGSGTVRLAAGHGSLAPPATTTSGGGGLGGGSSGRGGAASSASTQQPTVDAVKVVVSSAGMTHVSCAELELAGFDVGSDPSTWRLRRQGEPLPLRLVDGNLDPVLPPRWGFDFLAAPIEQDRDTRTDTYWLEIAPWSPGLRIAEHSGAATAVLGVLGSSLHEIQREQNSIYLASMRNGTGRDHWVWAPLVAPGVLQVTLDVDQVDTQNPYAELEVGLEAWSEDVLASLDHRTRLSLNGFKLTTVDHNGTGPYTLSARVPAGALQAGSNLVEIEAVDLGISDVVFLDRVSLRYRRVHVANDDQLAFSITDAGTHRLTGFGPEAVRLYRIDGPGAPVAITGIAGPAAGGAVDFFADVERRTRFEAFTPTGARSAEAVVPVTAPPVMAPAAAVDLIVISPQRFFPELAGLVALRRGQGLSVHQVSLESVFDTFGGGRETTEAIRDFLVHATSQWPQPAASAVLLVGDATYDPAGEQGLSPRSILPTRLIETPTLETASDAWFVDFHGTGAPALAIGRLPVATAAECRAIVRKIVNHERAGKWGSTRAVIVSDNEVDFAGLGGSLAALFPKDSVLRNLDLQSQSTSDLRTTLIGAWRFGADFVHYVGHGSRTSWAQEQILKVSDMGDLRSARLPLVTAMNCLNGYILHPATPALGEALVLQPQGGAVAYWGPTAITGSIGQQRLATEFFAALHSGAHDTVGDAIRAAKSRLADDPRTRLHLDTWILLGDPTTRVP